MFSKRRSYRAVVLLLLSAVVLLLGVFLTKLSCPRQGISFSQEERAIHELKNRTALPQDADFDAQITLSSILRPGEDRNRWSTSRAGKVEGFVVDVRKGGIESTNCFSPWGRDTHVHLALRTDAAPREQVVLEITPGIRSWAKRQGWDWSEATLRRELIGHWCYFEGWLFFDSGHAGESENTAAGRANNWRATAWEIHPVTDLKIVR
jgi:hypothetical protein